MADPRFFKNHGPFTLAELASKSAALLAPGANGDVQIVDVAGLEEAQSGQISFVKDKKYAAGLTSTEASACVVSEAFLDQVPETINALISDDPERAFAKIAQAFYPLRSALSDGISSQATIDPTASLGDGVVVEAGAVIGPDVAVGEASHICSGAVIGAGVQIGRQSYVGAQVSLGYALVGDRVIIHAGARIGEDGFGFAMGPQGHEKIPQLGRVIIQDDVEIGANTTIDRGAGPDTVIGEGSKIDNLVQIGHNVRIGRGCIIAGQAGVSGSTVLGDFVALGGQVGIADHITIGMGAQVAANAGVMRDVPSGGIYCGAPAKPIREFMREVATLTRLAKSKGKRSTNE